MATNITDLSQLDQNAIYSYADYLTWKIQERLELWKGKIVTMSPAPNVRHQKISSRIQGPLFQYFSSSMLAQNL